MGLIEDARGTTALHTSIRKGKWRALQRLLDALLAGRFGLPPRTTSLVMQCLESMANKYPREFLYLVERMPLEPEPEVLSAATLASHEIMLPRRLVAGSNSRCPRGVWESKIEQFRVARADSALEEEAEEALDKRHSLMHRALHRSLSRRRLSEEIEASARSTNSSPEPRRAGVDRPRTVSAESSGV